MRAYDGAEVFELVGLYLLNNLANEFGNSFGLYRDNGLALFKNINGHGADKIPKEFHQLFKENGLSLEIECNLKTVNYIDITLDLNTGTYKPYRKPNDETLSIYVKSDHPANILKQLPISFETRLSKISINSGIFHQASKHYQNISNQFVYNYKLQYKPQNNENESEVNRLKIAKEISSSSTRLFQRKSPTLLVNISLFQFKNIF